MLYIISGPSSVGKSIIINRFVELKGFKRFVPFTSRQRRVHENEIDGKEYLFRDKEELKLISHNFITGYWDFPFNNIYGYSADIRQTILSNENFIILATTKIALSIKKDYPSVVIAFIDFMTDKELERRINERFKPDNDLIDAKLLNAKTERDNKKYYDLRLENDDPNVLYEELVKLIMPQTKLTIC
jgi:guanylate kinase